MIRLGLPLLAVVLLAGCRADPHVRVKRLGAGGYQVSSDRCLVAGLEELEADINRRAEALCPSGHVLPQGFEQRLSRQGSLFGECLRSAALQARVICQPRPAGN